MELIIVAIIQAVQVVLLAYLAQHQRNQYSHLTDAIKRTVHRLQHTFGDNPSFNELGIITALLFLSEELKSPSEINGR